jgi:hypothetical protein
MIFVFQSLIYFSLTVMIDTCRLGQYKRADGNVVKKKEVREDLESELEAGLKIEQDVLDHAKDVREGRDFYIKAIDLSKAYKGTEEVQAIQPETCFGKALSWDFWDRTELENLQHLVFYHLKHRDHLVKSVSRLSKSPFKISSYLKKVAI